MSRMKFELLPDSDSGYRLVGMKADDILWIELDDDYVLLIFNDERNGMRVAAYANGQEGDGPKYWFTLPRRNEQ